MSAAPAGTDVDRPGHARILSWRRLLVCLAGGVAAAVAVTAAGLPGLAVLVGWTVAAAGMLTWVWTVNWPQDSAGTKRLAAEEAHTHVTDTVVLVAAVSSLAAVVEASYGIRNSALSTHRDHRVFESA